MVACRCLHSYDASRGLSRLIETWVSQAAAQQRRGRAGRVAPGTCYRLWPSRMWSRMAAQQPPEVLRVPLQQLCLTTKATLAAAAAASGILQVSCWQEKHHLQHHLALPLKCIVYVRIHSILKLALQCTSLKVVEASALARTTAISGASFN